MTVVDRSTHFKSHGVVKVSRPWENEIREGRVIITPELAEKILSDANYDRQRSVDHRDVGVYAEMMRRGLWDLTDPISFARFNSNLILVNGQHRCHAVVAYGRPVEFRVAINECATLAELKALFYRFDTVMRRRTDHQVLSAIDLAAEHSVSKSIATATYRAIGIIANGFSTPSNYTVKSEAAAKLKIVDLRVEACTPWWPAAQQLEEAMKRALPELRPRILRATTFSVALITMRYQQARAVEFWRGVAENDGLKRTDVRHLFVRDLLGRDVSTGVVDQGILTASIAWNAWYEGRQLKIIKVAEGMGVRIAGTPVGGRRA